MKPRDFCREQGYDKALLITYDFDALFFERVVLPDLWAGGSSDVQVIADLGQVSQALPRWMGQVRQLGQRYQLTCATMNGAFHPKIIVRAGSKGAAIWIGSGNLTHGGWGCNLELGTAWRVGSELIDEGGWLREVLTQISSWMPTNTESNTCKRIMESQWMIAAESTPTPPVILSRKDKSIGAQLRERWMGRRFENAVIATGSSDERGAMLKWLHDEFGIVQATVLLDPSMASFDRAKLSLLPVHVELVKPKESRTVHAKFYWPEGSDGSAAIMGSANCSAAAWLLSPDQGGNVEAIVIYDHPSESEFNEVLARFNPSETEPAHVVQTLQPEGPGKQPGIQYKVSEASWERVMNELTIVFSKSVPVGASVVANVSGERAVCHRQINGHVWSTRLAADPSRARGTVFLGIRITLSDGSELPPQLIWINDLNELRTAARGRGFSENIKNLGRWQPSSEHMKIVAELQKIGIALLSDTSLFPDPLSRRVAAKKETIGEDIPFDAPPVDPEQLIRSIDTQANIATHAHGAYELNGITLTGVMRALFEFTDEEPEASAADDLDDPGSRAPPPPGRHPPVPPSAPGPPERARAKLTKDMNDFMRRLGQKEFAGACTVTQMVQALAYPLAVVANGTKGGWLDAKSGQDWTNRVFDISFCLSYTGTAVGLIETVRHRCESSAELPAFRAIVGDGTLWAAMLASISKTRWTGSNGGIRKAFALRRVLLSQELLASTDAGRMSSLITNIERQSGLSSILEQAKDAKLALTELEAYLNRRWNELIEQQSKAKSTAATHDALFHAAGGWAFVIDPIKPTDESKIWVYRQNRAGEIQVKAGLYLNVTKLRQVDSKVREWFGLLDQFGK